MSFKNTKSYSKSQNKNNIPLNKVHTRNARHNTLTQATINPNAIIIKNIASSLTNLNRSSLKIIRAEISMVRIDNGSKVRKSLEIRKKRYRCVIRLQEARINGLRFPKLSKLT